MSAAVLVSGRTSNSGGGGTTGTVASPSPAPVSRPENRYANLHVSGSRPPSGTSAGTTASPQPASIFPMWTVHDVISILPGTVSATVRGLPGSATVGRTDAVTARTVNGKVPVAVSGSRTASSI